MGIDLKKYLKGKFYSLDEVFDNPRASGSSPSKRVNGSTNQSWCSRAAAKSD
jgi:hypothetical protein